MKQPNDLTWFHDCQVTCSCGNKFMIGSTTQTLQIDICDKCHPFFTGEMRFVDRQGRVDRFIKKQQLAQSTAGSLKMKKRVAKRPVHQSYRDILRNQAQPAKTPAIKSVVTNPAAKTAPAKAA